MLQCVLGMVLIGGNVHAALSEQSLSIMRKTFLQAESYVEQNRDLDFQALADTLKEYPLYPYLQYQWLSKHLDDHAAVLTFLHDYPASRYTSILHNQWLLNLGKNQNWALLLQNYYPNQNTELQCYFALARYHLGERQAALDSAKQWWTSGESLPLACDGLFMLLQASPDFSPDWVWQRFRNALTQNRPRLAAQMLTMLAAEYQSRAETWLKLHEQPALVAQPGAWRQNDPQAEGLFVHAIIRWMDKDPDAALPVWDAEKHKFQIPPDKLLETEKRLGMELAFRRDPRAYQRLSSYTGEDASAREWRVRAALAGQNWQEAIIAIQALALQQQAEDKWQYWLARALNETGQNAQAVSIYQQIAKNRSFHAFLAAERLQQPINLNHVPLPVTTEESQSLAGQHEFLAVSELRAIDRKPEAVRQWWHAVAEFDARQLQTAAKLAQDWDWPSIAIFTLAKANVWDDLVLRFPLNYRPDVEAAAERQALDPALIFALIRQESAFNAYAGSSAGALGLMQLMPKTARQVADELKENWTNDYNLYIPQLNIKLGSYYFKKLFNQYEGNIALASAAYNAGALKVKSWLPSRTMPADIWIETIPYKETRGYVASVVMYAMIYQQRLNRNNLKMKDLLGDIKPDVSSK